MLVGVPSITEGDVGAADDDYHRKLRSHSATENVKGDAVVDQADAKVQTGTIWGLSAGPHQAHKRGNNAYEGGKIG
ncbi:hypothetical protein LWI28_008850 [Acer negundo]|uniref:Uncharacterized protein n=1 Tax=Acer negundo TaxID=4023 RepID=A0AAD5NU53_ACENE|nr:hypothetical protein LWI28_008850 [Acer negundo]